MKPPTDAPSPGSFSLGDWRRLGVAAFKRAMADNVGLLSAGIAFYAFLSIFPAIAAGLMVWGLFNDTASLGAQLQAVRDFAPDAFGLVANQMVVIATQDDGGLTLGLMLSAVLALWGASGAVSALMQAMNMAYHESEKRPFFRRTLLVLAFTAGGIVFSAISLVAIAAVPPILKALYLGALLDALVNAVRWLLMIALFVAACAVTYRIGPSRRPARWRWIAPGALAAGFMWLVASVILSTYLENFDAYNATFGSLGAVAALLMWFWLSACAICLGAALNAQLELATRADTTVGTPDPAGRRGAYVADHTRQPET